MVRCMAFLCLIAKGWNGGLPTAGAADRGERGGDQCSWLDEARHSGKAYADGGRVGMEAFQFGQAHDGRGIAFEGFS